MFPELTALRQPIAIRTELIVDQTTTFRIQQHGKALSSGKFTVFCPDEEPIGEKTSRNEKTHNTKMTLTERSQPQALMYVDGKYLSRKETRAFSNASGLPLFDLYHKPMDFTWNVELPGGNGTAIAHLAPRSSTLKDCLDVCVKNAATNGEETTLHVRGQDIWKQRTNVYFGEKIVMTAKRTDKLSPYLPGKKLQWVIDIASGMDVALASVIIVVLAAIMYDSSTQSSSCVGND